MNKHSSFSCSDRRCMHADLAGRNNLPATRKTHQTKSGTRWPGYNETRRSTSGRPESRPNRTGADVSGAEIWAVHGVRSIFFDLAGFRQLFWRICRPSRSASNPKSKVLNAKELRAGGKSVKSNARCQRGHGKEPALRDLARPIVGAIVHGNRDSEIGETARA